VCGDLTSSFQSAAKETGAAIEFPPRDTFLESIHRAQFKDVPTGFHALSPQELAQIDRDSASLLARQEPGVRPSSPLPYELEVDGSLDTSRSQFKIRFEANVERFGKRAAGSPFIVHALGSKAEVTIRNYAVEAGARLEDSWHLSDFENKRYHLRAYGPNGFFREFVGGADDPILVLRLAHARTTSAGQAAIDRFEFVVENRDKQRGLTVEVRDNAYGNPVVSRSVSSGQRAAFEIDTQKSAGWYDVSLRIAGAGQFERRYAGRIETGEWSTSDPAMGRR
jgi:phospholipase C